MSLPVIPESIEEILRADPLAAPLRARGFLPLLGVSGCLLGEPVRYDGGHRRADAVADLLPRFFRLRSFCPEVAIGLGVPRPSIQRVRLANGAEIVRGVDNRTPDVTVALTAHAEAVLAGEPLHGYVFKARSPSCAPGNTPLFDEQDAQIGVGWGRYAEVLHAAWPDMPMRDEETLLTDLPGFVLACYRYAADVGSDR